MVFVVDKEVINLKRRNEIYRKSKVIKGNSESEYDKFFKDFKNDGDLGLDFENDDDYDDGDLDDVFNEEEVNFLVFEGNKDEVGGSKSIIVYCDYDGGDLFLMFWGILGDSSVMLGKLVYKKICIFKMKEIFFKFDSDIFKGYKSEECV